MASGFGALKRVRDYFPTTVWQSIFKSLVRDPIFDYYKTDSCLKRDRSFTVLTFG